MKEIKLIDAIEEMSEDSSLSNHARLTLINDMIFEYKISIGLRYNPETCDWETQNTNNQ